jgi:hypothetical protein
MLHCHLCDREASSERELRRHQWDAHVARADLTLEAYGWCPVCNTYLFSFLSFNQHLDRCHGSLGAHQMLNEIYDDGMPF